MANNNSKKKQDEVIKENVITLSDEAVRRICFGIIGLPSFQLKGLKNISHSKMTIGLKYKINTILTELIPCFNKTNTFIEENLIKEGEEKATQEEVDKIITETTAEYNIKKIPITSISDFPDTGELDFLQEIIDLEK